MIINPWEFFISNAVKCLYFYLNCLFLMSERFFCNSIKHNVLFSNVLQRDGRWMKLPKLQLKKEGKKLCKKKTDRKVKSVCTLITEKIQRIKNKNFSSKNPQIMFNDFLVMHVYVNNNTSGSGISNRKRSQKELDTNEPIFKAMFVSSTSYFVVAKKTLRCGWYQWANNVSFAYCFPSVYRLFHFSCSLLHLCFFFHYYIKPIEYVCGRSYSRLWPYTLIIINIREGVSWRWSIRRRSSCSTYILEADGISFLYVCCVFHAFVHSPVQYIELSSDALHIIIRFFCIFHKINVFIHSRLREITSNSWSVKQLDLRSISSLYLKMPGIKYERKRKDDE